MTKQKMSDAQSTVPEGEAAIRELLQDAGRRPEPPAQDMAVIRAAARSAWEELVESRQSRWPLTPILRGLALAAMLVLVVMTGWWLQVENVPDATLVATLELSSGEVLIGDVSAAAGAELMTGTRIVTAAGGSAGAALRVAGGQSLRLDTGTTVRFLSANTVELTRGAIYVDSPASVSEQASLIIETPLGSVMEVGTQYEVRLNGGETLWVRVREGEIRLTRDGVSHPAVRGEALKVERDGSVTRAAIELHGTDWNWVLERAPALEIEGRTLQSFLDWVARETAWEIRYDNADIEASALEIRLHGTIENLQPDKAMAMILRASGLAYRLEEGELLVLRP